MVYAKIRRMGFAVVISCAVMLAACGSGEPVTPVIELPDVGVTEKISSNTEADSDENATNGNYATDEAIPITWDVYYSWRNKTKPENGQIAATLNERFNVLLRSELFSGNDNLVFYKNLIDKGTLPDIFANNFMEFEELINTGAVRTIPWSMIERYAPRYAAMLQEEPAILDYCKADDDHLQYLFGLERKINMLDTLSVYRLDWLEQAGIEPPGEMVEIMNRVYFTDASYSMYEFMDILQAFKNLPSGSITRYPMTLQGNIYDLYSSMTLMGMWGLNLQCVQENGGAVVWSASDAFRSYLSFLESLRRSELVQIDEYYYSYRMNGQAGWWCDSILNLFGEYGLTTFFLPDNPSAKILLTPPEIGPSGMQGAYNYYKADDITNTYTYFISSSVSDEKLARILEIFEGVSFDPELYVLTNYGIEGEDFTWNGEPYASSITVQSSGKEYTKLFVTHTMDGEAGKTIYGFPSDIIYAFATSAKGQSMALKPYKYDPDGELTDAGNELNKRFPYDQLYNAAGDYMQTIISGEQDVASSWDAYLDGLNALGLAEYNALYDKMPYTNP